MVQLVNLRRIFWYFYCLLANLFPHPDIVIDVIDGIDVRLFYNSFFDYCAMPASCRLVALLVAICAAVALSVPSSVSLGYLRASGHAASPSALPLRQVIRLRGGSDAAVADPVQATPSVTPTVAAASEVVDPAQENVRSAIDTLRNK